MTSTQARAPAVFRPAGQVGHEIERKQTPATDNARDAAVAGTSFVEIQNTMLFATVGQRAEA